MAKIRVAIVGVGNCASSLVQGVHYYRDAQPGDDVPGLMHIELGGYHVSDLEFVAAFDVDAKKVGRDISEAVFASENNTIRFADVPPLGVQVDVLVCYLPVGSEQAVRYYADAALEAGVAFVNCLPVFIAGTPEWAER